ncbi:MAG: hypothetical protein R3C53_03615 [Pirellulaceae bacterium]
MNAPEVTNRQLIELAKTYWQWRWVWASTTAAFTLLGLFYVLFLKSDLWVASQGLIVRDEANGAVMRLGRFQSQTEMKAAQETVLEMAHNTQVLQQALTTVGHDPKWFGLYQSKQPPTSAEIESLAKSGIEVRAPRGAELGTTEVIYLDVRDHSPKRALQLNRAVCDALEQQLQAVRQARADGVISELTTARDVAQQSLNSATQRLQRIEAEAGADLSDLRSLTDANTGGSTNRQVLDSIKAEMRSVEVQLHQLATDMKLAHNSFDDPDQLLVTPSRLVTSQAGLLKLREGLAAAKIKTSDLKGRFTEKHPIVLAALETEGRLREQLREELGLAIQTLTNDIEVAEQQYAKLQSQQEQLESRLSRLAEVRALYANVAAEVRARSQELQDIERELSQTVAARDAAVTSSLITRLDAPMIGEKPIGPGRSTILAGSTFGGLFFGLGIVFLLTPLDGHLNYGRRRYDYSDGTGRRSEDAATPASVARRPAASPVSTPSPAAASTSLVAQSAGITAKRVLNQAATAVGAKLSELCERVPAKSPAAKPPAAKSPATSASIADTVAQPSSKPNPSKLKETAAHETAREVIREALSPKASATSRPAKI